MNRVRPRLGHSAHRVKRAARQKMRSGLEPGRPPPQNAQAAIRRRGACRARCGRKGEKTMAEDVKKIAGSRFIPQGLAPAEVDRYKQDLLAEVSRGVSRILADGRLYLVRYHWDDARDSVGS